MSFGRESAPQPMYMAPPPIPDAPPPPPSLASTPVQGAGLAATQAGKSKGGISSTILTSGQGDLLPANTGRKTLLGQ